MFKRIFWRSDSATTNTAVYGALFSLLGMAFIFFAIWSSSDFSARLGGIGALFLISGAVTLILSAAVKSGEY